MKKILVTGATGQLGRCIQDMALCFPEFEFVFLSKEELDITNKEEIKQNFNLHKPDFCINTAAYTNVDKAEEEQEKAFLINAEAVKNLAVACKENNTTLLHISTDYVFDGNKKTPYVEEDKANPINVYGASKLKGEEYIQEILEKYYIVRTSWLYSQYGHNFFKTILKHLEAGNKLTITTEQVGVPTNANDLAKALLTIIERDNSQYGTYHFSNSGEATWYHFAKEIETISNIKNGGGIAKTNHYPTFAKRPDFSVLNTKKLTNTFGIDSLNWKQSLQTVFINSKIN